MGYKFCRNSSILHGFRDISIFCVLQIFRKLRKNKKWPPFLARQNFLENPDGYSAEIPSGSKIASVFQI